MATTKIWAIKDSLRRVIDYAANPDKTDSDIAKALHYAENKDKTALDGEKTYLTTAINCDGDPLEAMLATQKYFGKKGGNVAYHAYQSFKPGEVTPEQCHKIGVELAKACKLSVSEMFRQIMRGQKLRSIPADAYTDLLFLFTALDEYIEHEEMESFFDQLQEAVHEFRETVENFYRGVNGDDKNMGN